MIIYKKYYFDAAHFMTNLKKGHKYTKVHGHSYEMIIKISGNLDKTNNWIMNYDDIDEIVNPLLQNDFGQSVGEATLAEKMMSHVVVGGEILFSENFTLRFGYNYRRRQEMKVDSKFSSVGFSWGFGIKVSKFQFNYARSAYHLVGSPNYITMIVNLSDF